ncbi:MAG TPA: polysaccharide biosynthesis tyrosine autokinase [Tepidisphaeraceae bacterium]|jgi:capsular exopolysaccharide synthesis family protein
MDIQNPGDVQPDDARRALALQPSVAGPTTALVQHQGLSVPELGSPRGNPLLIVWRRRAIVLGATALCVLGAWITYLCSSRVYRSEARLYVQMPGSNPAALATSDANTRGATQAGLQTQCELIKSAAVLAKVVSTLQDKGLKILQDRSHRLATLKDNLAASAGRDSDIITVTYDSPYADESQAVLTEVIATYAGFHTTERRARVAELERWRDRQQSELAKKQKELLEFKKANGPLSLTGEGGGNLAMQKLASLQQAITQARIDAVNEKTAHDAARAMMETPQRFRQLVDSLRAQGMSSGDADESSLRAQLLAMEQQLDQLRTRFGSAHPSILAAEASLASLKARLGDLDRTLAQTYVLTLEQKVNAAKNREQALSAAYEEQQKAAIALNARAAEQEQIDAEIKRLSGAVEKAEMQIVDASSAQNAGSAPTVQVLDEPGVPTSPIRPVRGTMLLQGLIIGLLLGCAAAVVRDMTDQSLRSTEDVTATLGVQMLGSVPHMPGPQSPLAQGRKVELEPAGDVAETYRTIRTGVFFGTPERESRTILVASPAPGDGRSTVASNLAIAMAQAGKRVLLLDADFRRPVQHRIFEIRPGTGLSSVIAGHEPVEKAIQPTGVKGLDILPAGPVPANPSELLNSPSFGELLEELSVRYEHVVLDSPPVMAVADARILAAMCSVSVLVLRAATTTRRAATHAKGALHSVGAHLLGVVVNDVPRARDKYGEYGGYGGYRASYKPDAPAERGASSSMVPARSFLDLRRK